jgi:hypothetical protein
MTIKTQGGKVITKDGKVSCECCGPPEFGACCFFSAHAFKAGLFSFNDLPPVVEVLGQTATKLSSPTALGPGATLYYQADDPFYDLIILNDDIYWLFSEQDTRNFCMNDSIEVPLASTYIVTGPISGTVGIDSSGSCIWSAPNLILRYNGRIEIPADYDQSQPLIDPALSGNFKWQVNGFNKIGNQGSPVGSYDGGFTVS